MTNLTPALSGRVERYPGAPTPPMLDTWQDAPHNRWALAHVSEFVPTTTIRREPPAGAGVTRLDALSRVEGLAWRLADAYTDAFVVAGGGEVIAEYYRPGFAPDDRHLLMSVSKSICGLTLATLIDDGAVDPHEPVVRYLPELADSAYGDVTVQHVLDMTVSVDYDENYRDPDSEVRAQDRIAGWRTARDGDPADTYAFLRSLRSAGEPGQRFQYCSADTDVLAWLIEAVTGQRYAEVVSERVWQRLGCDDDASITVDPVGFAFANGGISCTARDLARVGELMLSGGARNGEQVISSSWVRQTLSGGDAELARGLAIQQTHRNASYRNQWWSTGNARGNVYAVGIHGQYIWLDPSTGSVIVKLSSCPEPVTTEWNDIHAGLFADICVALEN
ncbi:serine hydrolase domain-containing protein [Microbacterium sp.]|uniref:serine hydrolase domain-containing protein n=1 Tax=Microbacterium sp. TaxID=51671 RepID=UPI003F99BA5A